MMKQKKSRSRQVEPATIKEIAARAGVSIGTVDRVVHGRGRVAPETERRVRRIIQQAGYRPNIYASHLSRAKTYHFGVVLPLREQDSSFWESTVRGVEQAVAELSHYRVRVKYFFYDRYAPEQFKRIERQVLAAPLDGLLCAPVLAPAVSQLVHKLPERTPYVFINTTLPGLNPLSFIGQDSKQSGLVCGRLMRLLVSAPCTVGVVLTVPNDTHIRARADGFTEAFADRAGVAVREYELFSLDQPAKADAAIDALLAARDLAGIFVANVAVHHIAARLSARKRPSKIVLIGYDLIPRNIGYLNDGVIDFLISQKPARQGYEGLYALYRAVALKESCPKKINMPIDIITKDNVPFYDGR